MRRGQSRRALCLKNLSQAKTESIVKLKINNFRAGQKRRSNMALFLLPGNDKQRQEQWTEKNNTVVAKTAHIERERPKSPRKPTARRCFWHFCVSETNRQVGSRQEVDAMPCMLKYLKSEWAFFFDERGRKKYNELCWKCEKSCKQSLKNK